MLRHSSSLMWLVVWFATALLGAVSATNLFVVPFYSSASPCGRVSMPGIRNYNTRYTRRDKHRGFWSIRDWLGWPGIVLMVMLGFLVCPVTSYAAPVTILDTGGADDLPGQKDLNKLTVDSANLPTLLAVSWNWDETGTNGNNTLDACSLYDTNNDGFANFSLCVVTSGNPATYNTTRLYTCNNTRVDRCAGPTLIAEDLNHDGDLLDAGEGAKTSTCNTAITASDPFPPPRPGEPTVNDTVATCTVRLADIGAGTAVLTNVCSYPSQEPNSDPSDCVVTPGAGFLTLVKAGTGLGTTAFTFNLGTNPTGQQSNEATPRSSFTISGAGSIVQIPFIPGTGYDLSELIPSGFSLNSASCTVGTTTGSFSSPTITNFEIKAGQTTTCTFTNSLATGTLKVIKHVVNDNGGTALASAWSLHVKSGGNEVTGSPQNGTESPGTSYTLNAGSYSVTETGGSSDYTASYTGDCDSSGNVTVVAGTTKTCTITNDDNAASLVIIKTVVNDNGGTKTAGDFSGTISGVTAAGGNTWTGTVTPGVTKTLKPCQNQTIMLFYI